KGGFDCRVQIHPLSKGAPACAQGSEIREREWRVSVRRRTWKVPWALNMKYPAELYRPSPRPYRGLDELHYPFHDRTVTVTHCGRICLGKRKINFSTVFAGQNVGIKEVSDKIWLVSFMHYDLGFFDHETCRLEPVDNPFEPKVSTMSPV